MQVEDQRSDRNADGRQASVVLAAEANRSASPGDAGSIDGAGVYVTDEVFLYRVVGFVTGPGAGMVELEDCYRLDVVRVPMTDLRARRLRVVRPGR